MFAIAAILWNVDAAFACSPKWKSYLSVMKNDLHQLLVAEETIYSDSGRFTSNLRETTFRAGAGVSVTIRNRTDSGYTAVATHAMLPDMRCLMYIGPRPNEAIFASRGEGEAVCDGSPLDAGGVRVSSEVVLAFFALLVTMTVAAWVFLRAPGRRNWPARMLVFTSLLYAISMNPFCGREPFVILAVCFAMGVGLFGFALRRRLSPGPLTG